MSILLAVVSTTPVPVQAIGKTGAVVVKPLAFPVEFLIYDASGDLQGPVANDYHRFTAPAGKSFKAGEVVGYVAIIAGIASFEVDDQHGTLNRDEETIMAKMTKAERAEAEQNLAICRSAVATFEQMLAADDAAEKSASKAAEHAVIRGIADRDGVKVAILAIRQQGRRPGQVG